MLAWEGVVNIETRSKDTECKDDTDESWLAENIHLTEICERTQTIIPTSSELAVDEDKDEEKDLASLILTKMFIFM